MWSVCDAFLTGFMVMLAQAAVRASGALADDAAPRRTKDEDRELAQELTDVLSEAAFRRDLDIVLAGLRAAGLL
jgi:hypothetical protein